MTNDSGQSACDALMAFCGAMRGWEEGLYTAKMDAILAGNKTDGIDAAARSGLEEILSTWAVRDKKNWGRSLDLGCTHPPTYNPAVDVLEKTEEIPSGQMLFLRQGAGLGRLFRFTCQQHEGKWRIQKKELLNERGTWQRAAL